MRHTGTMAKQKKRWAEFSPAGRIVVAALAVLQVLLAGAAWADLARRDAAQVNGSKRAWAWGIAVNFAGPVAYFLRGRRTR